MKIVTEYPPNYEEIKSHFELNKSVVFTYGDTIYNPTSGPLRPDLVAHEMVHIDQQKEAGGPEAWWARYLVDPQFRLEQELAAYKVQYSEGSKQLNRKGRREFLKYIAKSLSSEIYGNILTIEAAKTAVKGEDDE